MIAWEYCTGVDGGHNAYQCLLRTCDGEVSMWDHTAAPDGVNQWDAFFAYLVGLQGDGWALLSHEGFRWEFRRQQH